MTHLLARVGEVVARAIMLGLVVVGGVLWGPMIACWLVYNALRPQPRRIQPEYHAIVD